MNGSCHAFLAVFALCCHFAVGGGAELEDLYCGNWQAEYSRLHSNILKGEVPPRFVVSLSVESGLADNLVGLITEFYYALLTNRAFQLIVEDPLPQFTEAFDSPNINWTRHIVDPDSVLKPVRHSHTGDRKYGPEVDPNKYAGVHLVNKQEENKLFSRENLRLWPEGGNAETVFLTSNRGRVVQLFENPYHSHELYAMGLRPDTIFACGYKFLFKPNDAVKESFRQYYDVLQNSETALKIGLNIRAGDAVFNGHKVSEDYGKAYVECALQIEASRKKSGQQVIWYLMSESLELRRAIKEQHGQERTILTDEMTVIQHINCKAYGENACNPKLTAGDALRMAVGQLWVFSATEVQVISMASGFGRMGAFLSGKYLNVYEINGVHVPGDSRQCGRLQYDMVEDVADHASGIR